MTSHLRTITHGVLEWRGLLIQITFERQRFAGHIQIETIEPARAPLPVSSSGYFSSFVSLDVIEDAGGVDAYVQSWLDRAGNSKAWFAIEADVRQYALI